MKINEYKLDSWIYLSSGWEVLEDSHTTYNTTVCSGVSPSNTHSAYVHLCVLIFFSSLEEQTHQVFQGD